MSATEIDHDSSLLELVKPYIGSKLHVNDGYDHVLACGVLRSRCQGVVWQVARILSII